MSGGIPYSLQKETRRQLAPLGLLFIAATLTVIFAAIVEALLQGSLKDFDRAVLHAFRAPGNPEIALGPPWLQVAARDVTALGSTAVLTLIVLVTLGFLALKQRWRAAVLVLFAICAGTAISYGLKMLIERPRPDIASALAEVQTHSFPSGHAFLSAVTFLTLGALLAREQREPKIKIYLLSVATAITVLVGLSRVYIGAHWPTDVLAGWSAGAAWAILCWLAAERFDLHKQPSPQPQGPRVQPEELPCVAGVTESGKRGLDSS